MEVRYRNADGTYRVPVRWVLGDHARAVEHEDFDGDTLQDLLVAFEHLDPNGNTESRVGLLEGTGSGNLAPGWDAAVGNPNELVVGIEVGDCLTLDLD